MHDTGWSGPCQVCPIHAVSRSELHGSDFVSLATPRPFGPRNCGQFAGAAAKAANARAGEISVMKLRTRIIESAPRTWWHCTLGLHHCTFQSTAAMRRPGFAAGGALSVEQHSAGVESRSQAERGGLIPDWTVTTSRMHPGQMRCTVGPMLAVAPLSPLLREQWTVARE